MEKRYVELQSGRLKLSVYPYTSRVCLYWDGMELTKDSGFISIIGTNNGKRYYSDKTLWYVKGIAANEVRVLLKWQDLPIEQYWRIILKDEKTICWEVSIILIRKIPIESQEIGLMFSSDYTKWLNPFEEGIFPKITPQQKEWKDIPLKNPWCKSVGVRSCIKDGSYKPSVVLDFRGIKQYTELEIRNSHIFANLRGISVLIKPHSDYFENDSLSKNDDIFKGEIKFIDSSVELVKYIELCKKEEQRRLAEEPYLINQKYSISHSGVFSYLISRFRYHYYSKGFLYAVYRGIAYVLYCIRTGSLRYILFNSFRFKGRINKECIRLQLKMGRLKLLIDNSRPSIDIYWTDVKLTKGLGFITVMGDKAFQRHYSNEALWKVNQLSPCEVIINLSWHRFPVEQEWKIILKDEKNIKWDIWITPKRKVALAEKETGIMLSSDYTQWINSYEEGEFLEINPGQEEWQEMKIWNLSSKTLGVRGCTKNEEFKPGLILDFEEIKEDTEPKVRNSDYRQNLRVLLVQVKAHMSLDRYSAGTRYKIFSGRIKIIVDENVIGQHIIDCKKSLYRQRLPFIEEKMTKKYLSRILRPVEVLLVNLPWKINGNWGVRAGSRWPHVKNKGEETYLPFPFFLAYTGSVLLEHDISARIIDAIADGLDNSYFINLVNELEPELLIAEVSTPSLKNDLDILKKINKANTKIAVCGLDFNIRQPDFLKKNNFIDFVMVNEYEYTALELFEYIKSGKNLNGVCGLIYREDGNIKVNPSRPLIDDLDKLPWPLREQLPMEQYIDAPGNIPFPSVQMLASRGCPFKCIFCAWPQIMYNSSQYRMRKPKAIVDEMEYLIKERKFNSIYFDDDTFNVSKRNVLDLCKEIKERSLNVPWAIMARPDMMDEEMLIKMKEVGLHAVKYGVESADQKLLDNVGKNMNLNQVEQMIYFTKSLGIKTHLTFTFGLPGETKDTIKRTIDYAVKLDPDTVQFSILTPYPGTEYYNQLDAKGYIVSKDWSDYDGASKSVIRTEYLTPSDLEKAKEEALRLWKRHKRSKRTFITMPFDKELRVAFKNNMKTKGLLSTLSKTIKYIINA